MKRILIGVWLVVLLANAGAQSKSERFNLDFIFREPYLYGVAPQNPCWSPNDSLLLFTWNDQGTTLYDLWLADVTGSRIERLTDFAQRNERVNFEYLNWLDQNRQLTFMINGDVYLYTLWPKRELRRLTDTPELESHLCLSPDRQRLAYLRGNQLVVYDLKLRREQVVTIYPENGNKGDNYERILHWSPSGEQLAVTIVPSQPAEFPLLVIDLNLERLKKLEFIVTVGANDVIREFCWAPDENRIAVDIIAGDLTRRIIGVIDFMRSRLDTLYQEHYPTTFPFPGKTVLRWLDDGERLLFTSCQNGYRHLYLLNPATRRAEAITRGKWQVEDCQVDEAHKLIYFTGNRDEEHSLGVYALSLQNMQITTVSYLAGKHRIWLAPRGSKIAEIYANSTTPPDLYWIETKPKYRMHRLTTAPNPLFAEFKIIPSLTKSGRNPRTGQDINYHLYLPAQNLANRKYPLVIVLNAENALRTTYHDWRRTNLWEQWLSSQGIAVAEVEYTNLHRAMRSVLEGNAADIAAVQVSDVISVLEAEGKQDYIDINRIAVVGWGYGGYLAMQLMLKEGRYFRVGGAVAGLLPESDVDYNGVNRFFGVLQMKPELYHAYDLAPLATNLGGKLFLAQGSQSCLPHLFDAAEWGQELLRLNKKVDFRCYPWIPATFSTDETLHDLFAKLSAFLLGGL